MLSFLASLPRLIRKQVGCSKLLFIDAGARGAEGAAGASLYVYILILGCKRALVARARRPMRKPFEGLLKACKQPFKGLLKILREA